MPPAAAEDDKRSGTVSSTGSPTIPVANAQGL